MSEQASKPPTVASYRLSKAMVDALLYLLAPALLGTGTYPRSDATWQGLENRKLSVRDFRHGTGGRYLTDEGRRIATLIKESA